MFGWVQTPTRRGFVAMLRPTFWCSTGMKNQLVLTWIRTSSVCFVLFQTRLGQGRYVDPVFQHSRRHYVGVIRDLVKAGSVGFVVTAVEHVGLFFVAKKAGAQRFFLYTCKTKRHFLRPPTGKGLCDVEFQGAPGDAQNWFVGSAEIKMRIAGWLQAFFLHCLLFSHPKLVKREERSTKKRLATDSLVYPVPTTLPMGFSWAMFFGQDVTDHGEEFSHFFADRTPTHNRHLCRTVCSQARNASHALGSRIAVSSLCA